MKKKFILSLLLFVPFSVMAVTPKTNLVVLAKDGTKVAYALSENPKITFTETDLLITTNGVEINYALESMERFIYEKSETTFIINSKTDNIPFIYDGESILFSNLPPNSTISIYTLNGFVIENKKPIEGDFVYYLSDLENGIYIIVVNNITHKIVKK